MAQQLTDTAIKALPIPTNGNRITYDQEVRGLGVRVTSAGARAFIFNYRVKGTGAERRFTIGDTESWKLKAARDKAKELRRMVDDGKDPMGTLHAERAAPTMADLADRFETEHLTKRRASTTRDYKMLLTRHIIPALGNDKVAAVKRADIERLHARIAKTAPYVANRTLAVLSKMFNLSIGWEMRTDNPVIGIERAPEHKRERYLTGPEIARLAEVLADHPERGSANAIRLLLLTGARRGEVLSATWDQFDLHTGIWTKPAATTKQKKSHRVPLAAPALQLLTEMRAEADKEDARRVKDGLAPLPWLFPSDKDGQPQGDLHHSWGTIAKKAGLGVHVPKVDDHGKLVRNRDGSPVMVWQPTVRVHDLRHTYASILASAGISLPMIGALLGHTQAATTQRYAHLLDDPLRAATERAAAVITKGAQSAEVVSIRGMK